MSSWWGLIAARLGVPASVKGSHKRRVAEFLGAEGSFGSCWAHRLESKFGIKAVEGSYTSRMAGAIYPGAAARNLYYQVVAGTSVLRPGSAGSAVGNGVASGIGRSFASSVGFASGNGVALGFSVAGVAVAFASGNGIASGIGSSFSSSVGAASGNGVAFGFNVSFALKVDFSDSNINEAWVFW